MDPENVSDFANFGGAHGDACRLVALDARYAEEVAHARQVLNQRYALPTFAWR
jgi:hypothetical protein